MPTMKEIANALREAGDAAYDPENELLDRAWLDKYELLAAKVEQMRCETCRYYYTLLILCGQYTKVSSDCLEGYASKNQGPNFGCWNWQEKKVKNENAN